ncbi:unnamed protein product [Discosporangium mesarthrocarpum]
MWTDEFLLETMDSRRMTVMHSTSNRFMFWAKKRPRRRRHAGNPDWKGLRGNATAVEEGEAEVVLKEESDRDHDPLEQWQPPTEQVAMTYKEWREWADRAHAEKIGPGDDHYYLTTGCAAKTKTPPMTGDFVADSLPFFSARTNNFFVTDTTQQKGIQCRFGARGIIAESHFDGGKNFVLMLRGRKRYLINPPSACPALGIIGDTSHPSFRHSEVDWADPEGWPEGFADAPGFDTVVSEGELLYIPSYWYHYIVSESFSIQCNARSGSPPGNEGAEETRSCIGFPQEEAFGKKTRHLFEEEEFWDWT